MIIRILGEGQWDVPDSELHALNVLDEELEAVVHNRDAYGFTRALPQLLNRVRDCGVRVPPERIVPSTVILPPATANLDEVAVLLADDGLIPG